MTFGNPDRGLLRRILNHIYTQGQEEFFRASTVARELMRQGYTQSKCKSANSPNTVEESVTSYFSQNKELFEPVGSNTYRLKKEFFRRDLRKEFDAQALAVYENGKRELKYNGTRFLQKIRKDGGVAAAKSWLTLRKTDKPTKGFLKLVDFGKLDLSLEALVLREPWSNLFNASELEVARKRLEKYGFFESHQSPHTREDLLTEEISDTTFTEGAVTRVEINRYERDPRARRLCLAYYGARCWVCTLDLSSVYGDKFKGFIHVHHVASLASIGEQYEVDPIADLRPVCPNCHSIIHRRTPCYAIEDVRKMIADTSLALNRIRSDRRAVRRK